MKTLVKVEIQTADRTRRAQLTVSRATRVRDLVKKSRERWSLPRGVEYQVSNMSRGSQLLPNESLHFGAVNDGDVLVLQPMPTHG